MTGVDSPLVIVDHVEPLPSSHCTPFSVFKSDRRKLGGYRELFLDFGPLHFILTGIYGHRSTSWCVFLCIRCLMGLTKQNPTCTTSCPLTASSKTTLTLHKDNKGSVQCEITREASGSTGFGGDVELDGTKLRRFSAPAHTFERQNITKTSISKWLQTTTLNLRPGTSKTSWKLHIVTLGKAGLKIWMEWAASVV